MKSLHLGTAARSFNITNRGVEARQQMQTLSQELVTGKTANVAKRVSGNFKLIVELQHSMRVLDTQRDAGKLLNLRLDTASAEIGKLSQAFKQLGFELVQPQLHQDRASINRARDAMAAALEDTLTTMNSRAGGLAVFAGNHTGAAITLSADEMLTELAATLPPDPILADIASAVDAWFAPSGAFDTIMYEGGPPPARPHILADGSALQMDITAADPRFRDAMATLAAGLLMLRSSTAANNVQAQQSILQQTGEAMIRVSGGLHSIESSLGEKLHQLDRASGYLETRFHAQETTLTSILAVDEYATATKLQESMTRLDKIYLITSRMAQMSLSKFI